MKVRDASQPGSRFKRIDGRWFYTSPHKPKWRARAVEFECENCHEPSVAHSSNPGPPRFCSRVCRARHNFGQPRPHLRGANARTWKGGTTMRRGYVLQYAPDHPTLAGTTQRQYVLQHRLVMEQKLGRYLNPWEWVHHLNGDRADNRPENLELRVKAHGPGATTSHCATCTCFSGTAQ